MAYWLVKSEPAKYPFSQFEKDGETVWDGVRNTTARLQLLAMAVGDEVLFYHSNDERSVVGLGEVSGTAFPDPTADPEERMKNGEVKWVSVMLKHKRALANPVTLATIKATAGLQDLPLIKQSRLSVMPVSPESFHLILALSEGGENHGG